MTKHIFQRMSLVPIKSRVRLGLGLELGVAVEVGFKCLMIHCNVVNDDDDQKHLSVYDPQHTQRYTDKQIQIQIRMQIQKLITQNPMKNNGADDIN